MPDKRVHPDFHNVKYYGMRINAEKQQLRGGYKKRKRG